MYDIGLLYTKGHVFWDVDTNQGYSLTRDIYGHDTPQASDFNPVNGAPTPKIGEIIPTWLVKQIWPERFW